MADIPQNPTFSALTQSAYSLGRSLPKPRIDVNAMRQRVGNITSAIKPQDLGTITTPYGGKTAFEGYHPGWDIANAPGTPIPAFAGGTVTEVRRGMGNTPNTPSYGNYVTIRDQQNNVWRYSHLKNEFVKVGSQVQPGSIIGTMGSSGGAYSTTGGNPSHLDVRVRDSALKYFNPFG